jgi:hypothetical protein
LLGALLVAGPAAATEVFYSPSDDGNPAAGQPTIPEGSGRSVFVYVDGGAAASTPSSACDTGDGDEVCGFELVLTALNGLTLTSFNADPGADLVANLSAGALQLNGLDSVAPTPGPKRIGELVVDAVAGGEVELTSGEVIGADLTNETLATSTLVAVPEPGRLALLASGLTFLSLAGGRRVRR